MKSGCSAQRGQKRPASGGDGGQNTKKSKCRANRGIAAGRVNLALRAVNPAQDNPSQKRSADDNAPGSKRPKADAKKPAKKPKPDPPEPKAEDFCRGLENVSTERSYAEKEPKGPWNGEPKFGAAAIGSKVRIYWKGIKEWLKTKFVLTPR